jgi:hypothetical protein
MRVIEQLIDHLLATGHLTELQLIELHRRGLVKDDVFHAHVGLDTGSWTEQLAGDAATQGHGSWDEFGERAQVQAERKAGGRRGGGKGAARVAAELLAELTRLLASERGFADMVFEVAGRLDPGVAVDDAARLVADADEAALDAALARDSLWAQLWPHIAAEPIVAHLDDLQRRRFARLAAGGAPVTKPRTKRPGIDPVVRRVTELVEAHRVLSVAFGRVVAAIDPWRVVGELKPAVDSPAYTTMLVLHNARHPRRIAELADLKPDVVPAPPEWMKKLTAVDADWEIAARIDPVAVLPFMQWCVTAWAQLPQTKTTHQEIEVYGQLHPGNWIPGAPDEWFGVREATDRWPIMRVSPHAQTPAGEFAQTFDYFGSEYVHMCAQRDCPEPRQFRRVGSSAVVAAVRWTHDEYYPPAPGHLHRLWASGLFDVPLLTCPTQWAWT